MVLITFLLTNDGPMVSILIRGNWEFYLSFPVESYFQEVCIILIIPRVFSSILTERYLHLSVILISPARALKLLIIVTY